MAKERYVLFIFLGAVGLITMLSLLFHSMNASRMGAAPVLPSAGAAKEKHYSEDYAYSASSNALFFREGRADVAARPLLAVVGKREYRSGAGGDGGGGEGGGVGEAKNGVYLSFYDIVERKQLSVKMISPDEGPASRSPVGETSSGQRPVGQSSADQRPAGQASSDQRNGNGDIQLRAFYNGDIYFTVGRKKVYRVDRNTLETEDVTTAMFSRQPKLQTGIETVGFVPDNEGDGFSVLTTAGAGFAYYPLVDKLYTPEGLSAAEEGFRSLLSGSSERVYFTFSDKLVGLRGEKGQLLKITYKDNNGGPKYICTNFAGKDISAREKQTLRITGWNDLTPGRAYFDAQVVYGDAGSLLILFRADGSPDAPLSLQSLDPKTGSVKWTVACSTDGKPDKALPFRDGFILVKGNSTQVLDAGGGMQGEYKLK